MTFPNAMKQAQPKPRRRMQFGLRTLLALMLVFGVGTGWFVSHIRDVNYEDRIIAKLKEGKNGLVISEFGRQRTWVERLVGRDLYTESYKIDMTFLEEKTLKQLSELENVHELTAQIAGRNDLGPLRDFGNLHRLTIFNSRKLVSLDGIDACTKLIRVWIEQEGQLKDISALGKLESLENLCIHCSRVGEASYSIEHLANLPNLTALNLMGAGRIRSLESLRSMSQLKSLTLFGPEVESLDVIENCRELVELNLRECKQLEDLGAISNFDKLKDLQVHGSHLSQVPETDIHLHTLTIDNCESLEGNRTCGENVFFHNGVLQNLSGIESLRLAGHIDLSHVFISDVAGFAKLAQARTIRFNQCLLDGEAFSDRHRAIKKLQSKLPDTEIIVVPALIPIKY